VKSTGPSSSGFVSQPPLGTASPSGVVRMGNLNRLIVPLRNWTVHMIESVERRGTHDAPMGTKSA